MRKICFILVLILFFLAGTNFVFGEEAFRISRLKGAVNFDGRPFEDAWNGVAFLPMVMHKPNSGNTPGEKSEIMIAYNKEHLWVGARLYNEDPSRIVSKSKKRDEASNSSDSFGLILDSYDDNENALAFFTMPSGLRIDYSVSNDANGRSGSKNFDWNTFWDVKTSRDDKGWYVEMRIPFSSLRFQTVDNTIRMGMIVKRTISYNNETDTYPAVDTKHGKYATIMPSLAQKIEFEGIEPKEPIYFTPYILSGFSRNRELNPEGTAYIDKDDTIFEVGGDLKYGITSNLTLDVTVNTDFAQVEADDVQVNLTRYSLFFPEKRMFFQERSGIFDYGLGSRENLFYSRNIGTVNGSPVKILGGARVVGRVGKWDLGFLDMQTEEFEETPSENFGVFRMRRQVINPNSYVGGMITSRIGTDGSYNVAYGLDGSLRVFGDDYLEAKLARTAETDAENDALSAEPAFVSLSWERRSEKGFAYELGYDYKGREFNPGMGFVRQNGLRGLNASVQYGWYPGASSKWFNHKLYLNFDQSERLDDGKIESGYIEQGWSFSTKGGWFGQVEFNYMEEGVLEDFYLADDALVPAGDYTFMAFSSRLRSPATKSLSASFTTRVGEYYDGERFSFIVEPAYRFSSSFQLSGAYEFEAIDFPDRDQTFRSHIARAKLLYMYSTRMSASAFIQYNDADDAFITNFRLRYNPKEGNDLYLVFNEDRTVGNPDVTPDLPNFNGRTIMLKYSHTFSL